MRVSHLQETIERSKAAFYESEEKEMLSGAEFVYVQSKYIQKRWWVLQGCVLLLLWILLKVSESSYDIRRGMGVAAPLFAILLLPELWKNQSADAMEVEGTAFYSLREVYAARIFLFALVDFLLLCTFSVATVASGKVLVEEIIVEFFLPCVVTCNICFRTLYSRRVDTRAIALLFCIVWCAIWIQIVINEKIYHAISIQIWFALFAIAVLYLGYAIYRGQKDCREIWEVKPRWS